MDGHRRRRPDQTLLEGGEESHGAKETFQLTPDELLSTTRAVRKRLDLARPVERRLILECVEMAQQAPTGGNRQDWQFMVVTDQIMRGRIAGFYRKGAESYVKEGAAGSDR